MAADVRGCLAGLRPSGVEAVPMAGEVVIEQHETLGAF
jgi:hypothetical protein